MQLYDAHIHLDFMSNAQEVAAEARGLGLRLFACTVTPQGYLAAAEALAGFDNVDVGVGLHPWWVADGRCGAEDVDLAARLAGEVPWVGEVGLDFSPKRGRHDAQLEAFRRVAAACAAAGGKTLSIHSVRAADAVLDVLEETGCAGTCRCVFHWFSGSTEALWRAIRLGCWFSVNRMQASTRRAREQLKLIPGERLLFETDLPPGQDVRFSAGEVVAALREAQELTSAIRGGVGARAQ